MGQKYEKHDIVQALKQCASETGGTPTRRSYQSWGKGPSTTVIERVFGGWTPAIQAAGLDPAREKEEKFAFPQADTPDLIREIIERHREKRVISLNKYRKIVPIGDVHFPFTSDEHLGPVYGVIEREKPDVIVQVGDLKDMFAATKFPRSLNVFNPEAEFELAHSMAVAFWKKIRELAPKAECFQLLGNHDVRPLKRILERWPEGEFFVDKVMKDLFTFDGVKTIHDSTEELFIEDIAFMHGYRTGVGAHRDFSQMNVVHGHTHRGGVSFRPYQGKTLWELDCGLVADPNSIAMAYRQQKKIHEMTPGVGLIDQYGPRFIAF